MCANGYKNYVKSRPAASKDSVRRSKSIDLEKMRMHPLFSDAYDAESEKLAFINKMKNYKPQTVSVTLDKVGNWEFIWEGICFFLLTNNFPSCGSTSD